MNVNWAGVVMWLLGGLVSALLAYGTVDARMRVLEDRYERMVDDIREMKGDMKLLLKRTQDWR